MYGGFLVQTPELWVLLYAQSAYTKYTIVKTLRERYYAPRVYAHEVFTKAQTVNNCKRFARMNVFITLDLGLQIKKMHRILTMDDGLDVGEV